MATARREADPEPTGTEARPGPRRPTVSAIVPTRDEEDRLPFLLATLRWCTEVIVVDQASGDGTRRVARAAGARVLEAPERPDFDAGRALGAEAAAGDWLLTLDADEMIPVSLAARLRRIAEEGTADVVGIPRLNYMLGPLLGAGMWPDTQFRFFRRGAVEIGSEVHTFLRPVSERMVILPATPENAIHHFAYRGASGQLAKLDRYTELEIAKRPAGEPGWRQLLWEPLRVFLSRFVKQRGFRRGVPGLWVSVYWSFYTFVTAIKLWERQHLAGIREEEDRVRREMLAAWELEGDGA